MIYISKELSGDYKDRLYRGETTQFRYGDFVSSLPQSRSPNNGGSHSCVKEEEVRREGKNWMNSWYNLGFERVKEVEKHMRFEKKRRFNNNFGPEQLNERWCYLCSEDTQEEQDYQ